MKQKPRYVVPDVVNRCEMSDMNHNERVRNGEVCPYCGGTPVLIDSDRVYTRSYGMIWCCEPCGAWVGVHKGTTTPLGRLADQDLRDAKVEAHKYFDSMWRTAMRLRGWPKSTARTKAYTWLSSQMGKPLERTHIGMFDESECFTVVAICKPFFKPFY
jgi:ribosomal protein L37AE/L43A